MAAKTLKRPACPPHWPLSQRLAYYTDKSGGPDACWPWTGHKISTGYGRLQWKGKLRAAHRLTWVEANGPIPDGHGALHHCDHPPCCNPAHLWTGTPADNAADKIRKGRQGPIGNRPGTGTPNAKLTDAAVLAIRADTGTQSEIAKRFGVSQTNVCCIRNGKTWRHLP